MIVLKSKSFCVGSRCRVWCKMSNLGHRSPFFRSNGTLNSCSLGNLARDSSKYNNSNISVHRSKTLLTITPWGSKKPIDQVAFPYISRTQFQVLKCCLCSQTNEHSSHNPVHNSSSIVDNSTNVSKFKDSNFNVDFSKETNYLHFHSSCSPQTIEDVASSFQVVRDYLSTEEEEILMSEIEPHLKRLQYEFDHWDDAIHGFREIERGRWGKSASPIISRMKTYAFPEEEELISQVHILDLAKTGVIKPHVDSVRFCGNIISGVCLLSDAVMRLVHVDNKDQVVDVMLPRRALYIMRDCSLRKRRKYYRSLLALKASRNAVFTIFCCQKYMEY
ncbi:uncharacterized protein [Palaemon carinicauda]|uniref:uncharacterized protein isoform X2 n=1 Tax=Palaemon carinicauda TaxID=392227 RepID=UPI0035B67864